MPDLVAAAPGSSKLSRTAKDLADVDPFAAKVAHLLDDAFRVPGTNLRFGVDPILGFLAPGLGDAVTGGLGTYLFFVALRRGVPLSVIARMAFNVLVDTVVGTVPFLGDLFDLGWKANAKNLELIKANAGRRAPGGVGDVLLVLLLSAIVLGAALLPLVLALALGIGVVSLVSGADS